MLLMLLVAFGSYCCDVMASCILQSSYGLGGGGPYHGNVRDRLEHAGLEQVGKVKSGKVGMTVTFCALTCRSRISVLGYE